MNNSLTHYGVLGMKWGVRRNRKPKASSLSDDDLQKRIKRLSMESQHNKMTKSSKLNKTKQVVDATSTLANQAKNINRESLNTKRKTGSKIDLSQMTDQQLRERINRANLERQYNDMFNDAAAVSRGRVRATEILEVGGNVLAIGGSALGIALAIKELRGE